MKLNLAILKLSTVLVSSGVYSAVFAQDAASTATTAAAPQLVQAGTTAAAAPQGGPVWINFALMGGIILFMWLFVFRPQSKRAKEQKEFLNSLSPGIEVITAGGIIGTVVEVKDNVVSLNVGSSTLRVMKSSISGRLDASPVSIAK